MSQAGAVTFEWYDAWILYAVLLAARPDEYAPLDTIIGSADYINHAIPTSGELDGALSRLIRGGWVQQSGLTFAPSGEAEAMFARLRDRRTYVQTDLKFVRNCIGAEDWSPQSTIPEAPKSFVVSDLSEAAVQEAYDAYKSKPGSA